MYVITVKYTVKISQTFVAFSEHMNFTYRPKFLKFRSLKVREASSSHIKREKIYLAFSTSFDLDTFYKSARGHVLGCVFVNAKSADT